MAKKRPQEAKPARKPRARKVPLGDEEVTLKGYKDPEHRGRLASDIPSEALVWHLQPWITRGELSLVAGLPSVGKSTFVAHLVSLASHALILPGCEESVGRATLGRLTANGVQLSRVRFLDDRVWQFPRDKQALARVATGWEAEIIVLDPIDSYMEDNASENDGQAVRPYLESLFWVAQETGAAVVGVRHPGKQVGNVMPGSRAWRAVPRQVSVLSKDGSLPPRYVLTLDKDSHGQDARPRYYSLTGATGTPKRFGLDGELDAVETSISTTTDGPSGRMKVLEACRLLYHLFEVAEEPIVGEYVNQCRNLGIGEHARDDAKRVLSIRSSPSEKGGEWRMYRTLEGWPEWLVNSLRKPEGGVPQ
jgi:hypothetical protein